MKKALAIFLISIQSIILIIFIMLIVLSCCFQKSRDNAPIHQEGNTKWVSDDERIELYCVSGNLNGYLNVDGEKLMIYANIDLAGRLKIYKYDDTTLPEDFEEWSESDQYIWISEYQDSQVLYESGTGRYKKNSFKVKFDQTTYLEPGEKITFHKVEWTGLPEDFIVSTDEE